MLQLSRIVDITRASRRGLASAAAIEKAFRTNAARAQTVTKRPPSRAAVAAAARAAAALGIPHSTGRSAAAVAAAARKAAARESAAATAIAAREGAAAAHAMTGPVAPSQETIPVLARPWVHIHNVENRNPPSWLSQDQQDFAEEIFDKGRIHAQPILVHDTLEKMKFITPQVAFAGRSNVGKSILLNMLLHGHPDPVDRHMSERKKLHNPMAAPVSHKPGRTRHLFRFELAGKITFVDLPGYGYASAPNKSQEGWPALVDDYFERTHNLERVVSLVDAVVGVKESDERLWDMLQHHQRQVMVVLTKIDKASPLGLNNTMAQVISIMQQMDQHIFGHMCMQSVACRGTASTSSGHL